MTNRSLIATTELAKLLTALSHRHRVAIVEALRKGEQDVGSLQQLLQISTSRVSQHLRTLKSHHIVKERRDGRHVYYHLVDVQLATWLATGLRFVESELASTDEIHAAVEHTRHEWLDDLTV